tara:strand:- start:1958 stop:2581 length:624 start_codon:yes stop_codon:yes gene_type:complete
MEISNEWGVVDIYKFKLDEHEYIYNEAMKHEIESEFTVYPNWNAKVSHIVKDEIVGKSCHLFEFLINKIKKHIMHIPEFKGLSFSLPSPNEKRDIWMCICKKGDFQYVHNHRNYFQPDYPGSCKYNYIYFVKYNPEKDAKLVVGNPKTTRALIKPSCGDYNFRLGDEKIIDAQEGDLIIFPAGLCHYVQEQLCEGPRITIVGNLFRI